MTASVPSAWQRNPNRGRTIISKMQVSEVGALLPLAVATVLTAAALIAAHSRAHHDPAMLFAMYGAAGMPMMSLKVPDRCHASTAQRSARRFDRADLLALLEGK